MDKEVLATTAVKDCISWTDRLKPYIPEKDKEPIWDGSVYVYSTSEPSNETCLGRVPTQIKGTEVANFQEYETFDVPLSSLRKFLEEGGVIFFVVELSKQVEGKRIFYNSLLPFDIILLLESCQENQKTKRIMLHPFPNDNDEKVDVFVNFLQHREKHKTISSLKRIIPVENLLKKGEPYDLTITYSSSKAYELPEYAIGRELYMYFTDSNGVTFPIQHITNINKIGSTSDETIYCGEIPYNVEMKKVLWKGGYEFSFGKAFHFRVTEGDSESKFSFSLSGNLEDRIQDCELMVNLMQVGGFLHETTFYKLNIDDSSEERLAKIKKSLLYLKRIKTGLEYMGAVSSLDFDTLTEQDWNRINNLLIPASEGRPVSIRGITEPRQAGVLSIGNLNLMALAVQKEDDQYLLSNFFAEPLYFTIQTNDDSQVLCCYYVILRKEDIITLSNIDFSLMLKRIIIEKPHPVYVSEVNSFLLKLLAAYDDTKRDDILSASISLSEWLCSLDDSDPIGIINYLQAVKRRRPLEDNEKKCLLRIAYNPTTSNAYKMGANILLEDYQSVELQYNSLNLEERSQYEGLPIMTLWHRL